MLSAATQLSQLPSLQFSRTSVSSGALHQLRAPARGCTRRAHAVTKTEAAPTAGERATTWTWTPTIDSGDTTQSTATLSGSQETESHEAQTFGSFDQMLADNELPVLVDFQAPWCGPCQMMGHVVSTLSERLAGAVTCVRIDCDKYPALASRYKVQALPTLVLFKDGKPIDKVEGYVSLQPLLDRVNYYLGRRMGPGRRFTPTGTIDLGYRSVGRKKKVIAAAKQAAVPLQQSQPQAQPQAQPQPSPQA